MLISCGLGSGLIRPAPGTWGSLLGAACWWWWLAPLSLHGQLAAIVVLFAVGTWTTHLVIRRYGVHDPGAVVVDEVVGVWLALLMLPTSLLWVAVAFGLFRAFDILKPWPVGWADRRVPGALGVMLDDVLAGLLAWAVVQVAVLGFARLG